MHVSQKRLIAAGLIILAAVAFAVAGFILLPDTLVVQISAGGGSPNTMPKLLGLALPFALSTVFAVFYCKRGETKHLLISLLGLLVFALTFLMNL